MIARIILLSGVLLAHGWAGPPPLPADELDPPTGGIIQVGTMHEAIGLRQHHGRVSLSDLIARPHFYAVAALEGLHGEATVVDGRMTATTVDNEGLLQRVTDSTAEIQATMLVGAYVDSWSEHVVAHDIPANEVDQFVAEMAMQAGIDIREPFVITIEGPVRNIRLHVVNGACPIHARMKKLELPKDLQPFELELAETQAMVVGVFARDAVGKLTHPATSTHLHLVFVDPASQAEVTGHLEQIGIGKGAVLRLPNSRP